ncbi:hypothetical protein [Roseovarius sp. MMSF_3350]|uniref:hypothetical protein n=1 Tax=Roseovarius sp. MMSF_3350 TaxID=3046706 RepID=UPI00273DA1A0|nr:hypothetical protein [Roseovarius sp. MMSF_3350]
MVAYNFQPIFAKPVEIGRKRQTIRAHRKDGRHAKRGDALQLYTGMRTKACRKLRDATCTATIPVRIEAQRLTVGNTDLRAIGIAGDEMLMDIFAQADGFIDWQDMRDWFQKTHGLPFSGVLIKW